MVAAPILNAGELIILRAAANGDGEVEMAFSEGDTTYVAGEAYGGGHLVAAPGNPEDRLLAEGLLRRTGSARFEITDAGRRALTEAESC